MAWGMGYEHHRVGWQAILLRVIRTLFRRDASNTLVQGACEMNRAWPPRAPAARGFVTPNTCLSHHRTPRFQDFQGMHHNTHCDVFVMATHA
jgi:hypothetical protein